MSCTPLSNDSASRAYPICLDDGAQGHSAPPPVLVSDEGVHAASADIGEDVDAVAGQPASQFLQARTTPPGIVNRAAAALADAALNKAAGQAASQVAKEAVTLGADYTAKRVVGSVLTFGSASVSWPIAAVIAMTDLLKYEDSMPNAPREKMGTPVALLDATPPKPLRQDGAGSAKPPVDGADAPQTAPTEPPSRPHEPADQPAGQPSSAPGTKAPPPSTPHGAGAGATGPAADAPGIGVGTLWKWVQAGGAAALAIVAEACPPPPSGKGRAMHPDDASSFHYSEGEADNTNQGGQRTGPTMEDFHRTRTKSGMDLSLGSKQERDADAKEASEDMKVIKTDE